MEVTIWLTILLASVSLFSLRAGDEPTPDKPPAAIPAVAWYSDVGQAFADAHEKKLKLLLLMEMPDQSWSRQLLEKFSDPEIVAMLGDFVPVRVDVRKESQLLDQLVTRVVPDLRAFDPDGKQIRHTTGSVETAELKKFLTEAKTAKPEAGAPSLSMLFPSTDLEALLKVEMGAKLPEGQNLNRLIELAGGQAGETRVEAQRLLKFWARGVAPQLPQFLSSKTLKPRLAAYEALGDLEAPLESYDPWAGPASAELVSKLQAWGKPIAEAGTTVKPGTFSALSARARAQVDLDLKDLRSDDKTRQDAAWQRLISVGRGLVPVLRDQSRALVAGNPDMALRFDEMRFRLLLGAETLRKRPTAPHKLAVGNPGERAKLLAQILQSGAPDMEALAREASCDRDPLFRETAIRNAAAAVEAPEDLFKETLKDADSNVRVAALTAMAQSTHAGNAEAIAKYIANEPNADMIGHAVRALSSVTNEAAKKALRDLLKDKRWEVRAAAVEALGKMRANAAMEEIEALAEGEDGFVAGQAITALAGMDADNLKLETLMRAVKKHPAVTLTVIKAIGSGKLRQKKEADTLLRTFTKDGNPDVRAQALTALASDTSRPAFEEVAAAMNDPAAVVRSAAVRSMRALIEERTIANLRDAGSPPPDGYVEVRGRIQAMLKDADEELRSEAIQTLCYFGDWNLCWNELKGLLVHPREHTRDETYNAVRYLPGPQLLAAVRICIADKQNHRSAGEWHSVLYSITHTISDKASEWKPADPALQALFEVFPNLDTEQFDSFLTMLKNSALNDRYGSSQSGDQRNRIALAKIVDGWVEKLPAGAHKHALRLLWLENAELDDAKLREFLKDADFEIRRMAFVVLVRAQTKGPVELVKEYLTDTSADMRRLAVAAAIPSSWRERLDDDPTSYSIIEGQKMESYHRYSSLDITKPPAVVQLPVETLDKLLKDDDEPVRVLTAFLMAMEGGDQGIQVLAKHLKSSKDSTEAAAMLARAVILAWSDELSPQLEEACRVLNQANRSYEIRQLWPNIKGLPGAEIKKLRPKLLKETSGLRD